jgi:hypothetical protein
VVSVPKPGTNLCAKAKPERPEASAGGADAVPIGHVRLVTLRRCSSSSMGGFDGNRE